jgi:hypothetical protein
MFTDLKEAVLAMDEEKLKAAHQFKEKMDEDVKTRKATREAWARKGLPDPTVRFTHGLTTLLNYTEKEMMGFIKNILAPLKKEQKKKRPIPKLDPITNKPRVFSSDIGQPTYGRTLVPPSVNKK